MSDKNTLSQALTSAIRHPDYKREIAALLRRDERCRLYALLDAATLAGVLEYTEDDMPKYLEELGIRKKLEILPLLDPSAAADYLKGLTRQQRSALIDLMDEDVSRRQKLALVGKEAQVGLVNGIILGLLSFAAIGLYLMVAKGHPAYFAFSVSFCTGVALMASMLLSSIIGTTVPMLFKRMGVDPAVASGPLITTVNDLVAVTAYYGLVWILLIELLHF